MALVKALSSYWNWPTTLIFEAVPALVCTGTLQQVQVSLCLLEGNVVVMDSTEAENHGFLWNLEPRDVFFSLAYELFSAGVNLCPHAC